MYQPRASAGRSPIGLARLAPWLALALLAGGCDGAAPEAGGAQAGGAEIAAPAGDAVTGPRVRVVGTVQDGGLPHVACTCPRCEAARADPARVRHVAALAVVVPGADGAGGERVLLIDATPDLAAQLDMLDDVRRPERGRVDRAPVDGVILTHAHVGHYLGLALLGFEAVHARGIPVWCTPRMAAFLRGNEPWRSLVERGNVDLREIAPGGTLELDGGVTLEAFAVPHRDELSDTIGLLLRGPRASVVYVPDTDGWDRWPDGSLERLLGRADVALLDGTFWSPAELPGREVSSIGHPLITDSMERLAEAVEAGRLEVRFTHLNHSNPALDPGSPERAELRRRGFEVAREGEELPL